MYDMEGTLSWNHFADRARIVHLLLRLRTEEAERQLTHCGRKLLERHVFPMLAVARPRGLKCSLAFPASTPTPSRMATRTVIVAFPPRNARFALFFVSQSRVFITGGYTRLRSTQWSAQFTLQHVTALCLAWRRVLPKNPR